MSRDYLWRFVGSRYLSAYQSLLLLLAVLLRFFSRLEMIICHQISLVNSPCPATLILNEGSTTVCVKGWLVVGSVVLYSGIWNPCLCICSCRNPTGFDIPWGSILLRLFVDKWLKLEAVEELLVLIEAKLSILLAFGDTVLLNFISIASAALCLASFFDAPLCSTLKSPHLTVTVKGGPPCDSE